MSGAEAGRSFPVIAIDGGAGTGKTTSAALVAKRLGFCYVDSGAVYRAIAAALRVAGVVHPSDPALAAALAALPLHLAPAADRFQVLLSGKELGDELRTPAISQLASKLAVDERVRARVGVLLREAAGIGPLVVEGRDIGTVVFPQATLKVFLTAGISERARRRRADLLRQGIDQPEEQVARDLDERDQRDSTRAAAPLREADGALRIDTGRCTVEEQVDSILRAYRELTRGGSAAETGGDLGHVDD
jgi:cytidylate kinase